MGVEFELKYRANRQQQDALRQAFAGEETRYQMQTTYYDTPTGSFSGKKCTLRRRLENGVSICTLKTPAAGYGRQEWETECDKIETAIDALCKLGGPKDILAMAEEGLIPICGARFTRIAKVITFEGALLELALDEGILTGGGREVPLCEVEVELKEGSREACLAFARRIEEDFGLTAEEKSKFRRALDLYKGESL